MGGKAYKQLVIDTQYVLVVITHMALTYSWPDYKCSALNL